MKRLCLAVAAILSIPNSRADDCEDAFSQLATNSILRDGYDPWTRPNSPKYAIHEPQDSHLSAHTEAAFSEDTPQPIKSAYFSDGSQGTYQKVAQKLKAAHGEFSTVSNITAKEVETVLERCGQEPACLERGLTEIADKNQSRLGRFFSIVKDKSENLCMISGGASKSKEHATKARMNYLKNLGVALSGITLGSIFGPKKSVTYENEKGETVSVNKLPIGMTATSIIMISLFAEVACRSTATVSAKDTIAAANKTMMEKFKPYILPTLAGAVLYAGLISAEDYFVYHQKDAYSAKSLKNYLLLGFVSTTFDLVFAFSHAVKLDDLAINGLPKLKTFIANWVKSPEVQKNIAKIVGKTSQSVAQMEAAIVSNLADIAIRVGYSTSRTTLWLKYEKYATPIFKNSPLFSFMFEDELSSVPAEPVSIEQ